MSGHNRWSQIKHRKAATDAKKSNLFSKLVKEISVAAREESNPDFNPRLRSAIERAREANMPSENIERAIKKATEEKTLEEITLEAYGPGGIAIIAKAITDNPNRTIPEIKHLLSERSGKWAEPGSVAWAFEGSVPKFPQDISGEDREKLKNILNALENHDDIQKIFHNAKV